jgi:hypothetical protein
MMYTTRRKITKYTRSPSKVELGTASKADPQKACRKVFALVAKFCTWQLFMLHRYRTFSRSEYSRNGRSHWNSSRICKISGNTCLERNRFNSNSTCKVHAFQIVRKFVCILASHKISDEDVKAYISMTKMALQSIVPTAPNGTFSF